MRIVIEMTKTANPNEVLKTLYRRTSMQATFGINMLALLKGEPHKLTLKQALKVYADHRLEVIKRRSEYELRKAEERQHILKAYLIALENLDEVIDTIRRSQRVETAPHQPDEEVQPGSGAGPGDPGYASPASGWPGTEEDRG